MVLFTDERVVFLIWFVGVAVVVAAVLIFIDILVRRRRGGESVKIFEETVVGNMQSRLKEAKSLKEKLDIVSDTAKKYFQGAYGVSPNVSYSKLIKGFEKANRKNEVDFCKKMFAAHYSEKDLSEDDITSLAALLFDIETAKIKEDKVMSDSYVEPKVVPKEKTVAEGKSKVVDDLVVAEKAKVASDRIRAIEEAKKAEIEGARKAIMEKVDMMKSGFEKNVEETLPRENVMEGIAQKIIRKEKERLQGKVL